MVNKMATYISGGTLTGNNNNKPQSGQGANTVERQTGVENPVFNMSDSNYQGTIHRGQLPPAPSEVSAWQANGTLKDEHPMGNFSSRPGSGISNGKVQNIYWPNGSIPRRVKKLSWEDEQPNRVSASKLIVFLDIVGNIGSVPFFYLYRGLYYYINITYLLLLLLKQI